MSDAESILLWFIMGTAMVGLFAVTCCIIDAIGHDKAVREIKEKFRNPKP